MCYAPALGICTQTCSNHTKNSKSVDIRQHLRGRSARPAQYVRLARVFRPSRAQYQLQVQYTTDRPRSAQGFLSTGYISAMGVDNTRICISDQLHSLSTRDRRSLGVDDTSLLWHPMASGRAHISRRQVRAGEGLRTPLRGPRGRRGKRCLWGSQRWRWRARYVVRGRRVCESASC